MKIAIVKLSALGDIVHAMVALQFLKAHVENLYIDWIVEERFAGLLEYNPDINAILTVNLKGLKRNKLAIFKQYQNLKHYAENHYDLVIDAQGLIKSAITSRLIGKRVAGFDADSCREKTASRFYDVKINCPYEANTIDRIAKVLAQPLGFAITPEQIMAKKPFLFFKDANPKINNFLVKDKKNIILVIGSTWPSRNYPPEKFVVVADALKQNCLVVLSLIGSIINCR
jgi:heptosyltransferase-1